MLTRAYEFTTVDVFTTKQFGGNPLAVFPSAAGLSDAEMQSLAAEMNLSETTFVLPAEHAENSANVRIFNRTSEMPFAGHPNVGTAYVLASLNHTHENVLRFEELAGLVEVQVDRDSAGAVIGATIQAPQSLSVLGEIPPAVVAMCVGLDPGAVRDARHLPVFASVGIEFVLAEVGGEDLGRASPNLDAFRRAAQDFLGGATRFPILLYAWAGDAIRARMFAPISGTWEDPATGSANAALAAFLLSLGSDSEKTFQVSQGSEMGRPSDLRVRAWRSGSEIRSSVGGHCVPMFRGQVAL
jgi:trans-2,3-dihydro-3-hydroxyanthranilate isomerase